VEVSVEVSAEVSAEIEVYESPMKRGSWGVGGLLGVWGVILNLIKSDMTLLEFCYGVGTLERSEYLCVYCVFLSLLRGYIL
jgi:hypothetical protein